MTPARPWSRRMEGAVAVAFWFTLGLLMSAREISRSGPGEPIAWNAIAEMMAEIGLWALLTPAVFWLVRRAPAERGAWVSRIALQVVAGLAIAFVVEYITRGVFRPLLRGPVPLDRQWTAAGSFVRLRMLDEVVVYLAILAAGYARTAMFQVQERRAEAERLRSERAQLVADRARLEAQLAEARLSALRMQLNPHFLFNTLNAVSALVEHDPAGVRTMIARLSSLLRRVLDSDGSVQEMPLREEADFLRDYLDVQQIRLQDRLRVEESWEPGTLAALVPPLILQPLVENAVGHGISQISDRVGTVRLSASRVGATLVLRVEDDGPGLPPEAKSSRLGVGLANTRARLDALYGGAASLTLSPASGGGVVAEVVIPYRSVGSPEARAPLQNGAAEQAPARVQAGSLEAPLADEPLSQVWP
ncbi:hypothetical protein BSZ36_09955 [Rubricoccus marinus]|uniref:Histidine kinase domain-containing protein n=2 Tax=Rubricoccus marinus TaxID=716817 RepID=A0A259TZR4_9BACT|nr:hypothetical protein BSZ36_09955 [Rubricoccus marinus]